MDIVSFAKRLGLSDVDILKLGFKIQSWQKENLSDIELKEKIIKECVLMSNKNRDSKDK